MSIEHWMDLWNAASYDRIECAQRDSMGNPEHIKFYRKGKHILSVFIHYDEDGNWESIASEKPGAKKK